MNQNKILDTTKIPTQPYPELREVLHTFVERLQSELGDNLLGFYLVGSLASGDFDLDSDVDFLAVIQEDLGDENVSSLEKFMAGMHRLGFYPAQHLEGSFITLSDLKDWGTVRKKKLVYFDNGSTRAERSIHDNQWHVRWQLREAGSHCSDRRPKPSCRPSRWIRCSQRQGKPCSRFSDCLKNRSMNR